MTDSAVATNVGTVVQVIGSTLDAEFDVLPAIYNALSISLVDPATGETKNLIAEVQLHLGRNRVRAVALASTDGLSPWHQSHRHRRSGDDARR